MKKQYKVCARCFTYNQSEYILDTLGGFVMQQTTFPFVAIVVDDASTDGTQQVIRQYIAEQFDTTDTTVAYQKETDYAHITFARHKTNSNCYIAALYLKENHYNRRKPKMPYLAEWRDNAHYEAICEGDDYWTHPHKLQQQADYLDTHPQCGLVYAQARTYIQRTGTYGNIIGAPNATFEQLLYNNVIPTLTVMYRISVRQGYNDFVAGQMWLMGDYPLWLYIAMNNKIHFIDECMAVYRMLENSASHSTDYWRLKKFFLSTIDVKRFFLERTNRLDLEHDVSKDIIHEIFFYALSYKENAEIVKYYKLLDKQYKRKRYRKKYYKACFRLFIERIFNR